MQILSKALIVPLLFLSSPSIAATTPTQWGVSASTSWADCSLVGFCSTAVLPSLITEASSSGGLNDSFAEQIAVSQIHNTALAGLVDMGDASAQVSLDTTAAGVPVLRAEANSNSIEGWVSGFAFSLAGFTYTGGAGEINLDATLDGTITNPESNNATGLSVGIWIIRDDGSITFPVATTLNELAAAAASLPVEDSWVAEDLGLGLTNHSVNLATSGADTLNITFTTDDILNGNTNFYIMAGLVASSTFAGQFASSMSTLTMSFDDTTNIVSAAPVPLPPAVWMFSLAWFALLSRVVRR